MPKSASLHFHSQSDPVESGEAVLWEDGTFQVLPSAALRQQADALAGCADRAATTGGVSGLMALAAVGAALYLRGKRGVAWGFFAAAGTVGVLGAAVRFGGRAVPSLLFSPQPVSRVTLLSDADGGIGWTVNGGGPLKLSMKFVPGEFDAAEARVFVAAFERVKAGR